MQPFAWGLGRGRGRRRRGEYRCSPRSRLGFSTDRRTGVLWVTSEQIYAPGLAQWQEGTFLLLTDGVLCKYDRARGGSSPRA